MNNDKAYVLGFMSFAFATFLGSKYSPNYLEFVSNGNNFLIFTSFGLVVLIGMSLIDFYFGYRKYSKGKVEGKR